MRTKGQEELGRAVKTAVASVKREGLTVDKLSRDTGVHKAVFYKIYHGKDANISSLLRILGGIGYTLEVKKK